MKYQVTTTVKGNKITVTFAEVGNNAFSQVVEIAGGIEYREVFVNKNEAIKFFEENK